jgi:hypothetical protein
MAKPPKAKVKVFNYGVQSAQDYWVLVTRPDVEEFNRLRSPRSLAHVVQSLWGLLEWHADEYGNGEGFYFQQCPELAWIKDIAKSAKHRGLYGRREAVADMGLKQTGQLAYDVAGGYGVPTGGYGSFEPVAILDDHTEHRLLDFVEKIEAFWQAQFL